MATFYLDPENGNDANDGTTFANRWQTPELGATAARIAPGDVIRVIADYGEKSLGEATVTDDTVAITLPAAVNATISNCEAAGTASANVTATTSTTRKQGSFSTSLAIASGFTTGKVWHSGDLGTLDLSAFQGVTLWLRTNVTFAEGVFVLNLCTDTTGDTVAHALNLPIVGLVNTFTPVRIDTGGNLNAAIRSISITATSDIGAVTLLLDNIQACKGLSDAAHLSLMSLLRIGDESTLYPIKNIVDDVVTIGSRFAINATTGRTWRGTTGDYEIYAVAPLTTLWSAVSQQGWIQDSGSDGSPITFSGGWNRTDMSTQTGTSWCSARQHAGDMFYPNSKNFITVENIGLAHMTNPGLTANGQNNKFALLGLVDTAIGLSGANAAAYGLELDIGFISHPGSGSGIHSGFWSPDAWINGYIGRITGVTGASTYGVLYAQPATRMQRCQVPLHIGSIDNCDTGVLAQNAGLWLSGTRFQWNDWDFNSQTGMTLLRNCSFPDGPAIGTPTQFRNAQVDMSNVDGDPADARSYRRNASLLTASDQRHTASGVAWKCLITSASVYTSRAPLLFTLGRIAVVADVEITISCWVRRDNTGLSIGVGLFAGDLDGVETASDLASGSADTWEQVSLTVTPTMSGVLEVYGLAWGGTTYSGWWDDLAVTPT